MAKTVYSHELRTLLCPSCGAPVEVSPAGGAAPCAYCGAVHELARRDESEIRLSEGAPQMGESERFGLLRAQDAAPRALPPGLERLVVGAELAAERRPEALGLWQGSRRAVAQGAPFPEHDRLFFLTVLLARAVDDRTRRGLLESALELLGDPRHRQVLRCRLAEGAVLAGDLEAARQWLAPCDPRPTDLHMDTAYRVAASCLAAAERRPGDVLALLGTRPGDVPLADEAEAEAELLRADAVERSWGPGPATEQLLGLMLRDPRRLHAFEAAARHLAPLGLCPESGRGATAAFWSRVDAKLRPTSAGSVGCLVALAVLPLAGLGLVAAALGGLLFAPGDGESAGVFSLHATLWLVLLPGGFLVGGIIKRKRTLALRARGVATVVRVLSCTKRVSSGKSSTTVFQELALQVTLGATTIPLSKTLTRDDPVPLGVYPCLVDPQPPHTLVLQPEPLD